MVVVASVVGRRRSEPPVSVMRWAWCTSRSRIASDGARQTAPLSLHAAHFVIAREYGFATWPRLKAHIDAISATRRTRLFVREVTYYEERAQGLLAVVPDGAAPVMAQVRQWHPDYADADDDAIRTASLSIADARLVYAREHGFTTWPRFVSHLGHLDPDAASRGLCHPRGIRRCAGQSSHRSSARPH